MSIWLWNLLQEFWEEPIDHLGLGFPRNGPETKIQGPVVSWGNYVGFFVFCFFGLSKSCIWHKLMPLLVLPVARHRHRRS